MDGISVSVATGSIPRLETLTILAGLRTPDFQYRERIFMNLVYRKKYCYARLRPAICKMQHSENRGLIQAPVS